MNHMRLRGFLTAFTCGLFLIAGCESSKPSMPDSGKNSKADGKSAISDLEGKIQIDGSSTVYPITEAVAGDFKTTFPKVNVTVGKSGTGGGFKRFVKNDLDISDASRPIKVDEMKECAKNGVKFVELPIAFDGLAICVHKENNFINEISIEDLKKIFSADIAAKTWQDLNPSYPAEQIKIFMPGTDSGTYDFFKEVVLGKEGKVRSDVTPSEEDLVIVNGIENEKYAIGFFGASYYFEAKDKLKALKVIDPKTSVGVEPTVETIENSTYSPLGRPIFIYVNEASAKKPEVRRFVEFYLDHAAEVCRKVKCVPLPAAMYKTVRQNFDDRAVGTHFHDQDGGARSGSLSEVFIEANLNELK
jgi:phosphate transport system substrate-binding protein